VDALGPAATSLPAGLAALRGLSNTLRPAVTDLRVPVARLVPTARELSPAARNLSAAAELLNPQVPVIDKTTHDLIPCLAAVEGFFQWTANLVDFDAAIGGGEGRGDFTVQLDSGGTNTDPNIHREPSCAPGRALGGAPAEPNGWAP
jgi:hypothetical protein